MVEEGVPGETAAAVAARLSGVRDRVEAAARRSGRNTGSIALMAVTKGFPQAAVRDAVAAGAHPVRREPGAGSARRSSRASAGAVELHLIGHLQRNKAQGRGGDFSPACSPSTSWKRRRPWRERVCRRGQDDRHPPGAEHERGGDQVRIPRTRDELAAGPERSSALPALRLRGLMTVGPLTEDAGRVRAAFAGSARPLRGACVAPLPGVRHAFHGDVRRFRDGDRGGVHAWCGSEPRSSGSRAAPSELCPGRRRGAHGSSLVLRPGVHAGVRLRTRRPQPYAPEASPGG